jgi:hypothetical protein
MVLWPAGAVSTLLQGVRARGVSHGFDHGLGTVSTIFEGGFDHFSRRARAQSLADGPRRSF